MRSLRLRRLVRLVPGCVLLLTACAQSLPTKTALTPAAPLVASESSGRPRTELGETALRERTGGQVAAYLKTLETLVGIESGSHDLDGLERLAAVIAGRLRNCGLQVELKPAKAPDFHPQLQGARLGPMVYATRLGTGQKKVLLIAHMDTVYPRGSASRQPFRIEGDRAHGLGIADDKQGVALILHTVELLARDGFSDYAQLGVLINGDEEIGSPGSGPFLTQLGGEYDAVLSFEGGGSAGPGGVDMVRLATSSIATVTLKVTGRASHAGAAPEQGRNALYELAHQVLKSRRLGDPGKGLRINWTLASAGTVRNAIPAQATAVADVRSLRDEDLDLMEAALRRSIQERLIPDTRIDLDFYRGRPAFAPNAASRALAAHAVRVYREAGLPLVIRDRAGGGGTDAAFAGLRPRGGVLEGLGLRGFGSHTSDSEFILVSDIAPRLYLAARMVMDAGRGRIGWQQLPQARTLP